MKHFKSKSKNKERSCQQNNAGLPLKVSELLPCSSARWLHLVLYMISRLKIYAKSSFKDIFQVILIENQCLKS